MVFLGIFSSDEKEEHIQERDEYVSDAGQDARAVAAALLVDAAPEHDVQDLTLQPDPEVRRVVRISMHL